MLPVKWLAVLCHLMLLIEHQKALLTCKKPASPIDNDNVH